MKRATFIGLLASAPFAVSAMPKTPYNNVWVKYKDGVPFRATVYPIGRTFTAEEWKQNVEFFGGGPEYRQDY